MTEPTVYIVDDDADIRAVLSETLRVVGCRIQEFAAAADFLAARDKDAPGCLLTDLRLPGMDGCQLLDALTARGDHLPTVVISAYADVPTTVRIMRAGGLDVLEKPSLPEELINAVRRALERDRVRRVAAADTAETLERFSRLTPRERQVFTLVAAGRLSREIGEDLGISINTVEIHRTRVMRKMQAGNVAELVRLAIAAGIVT